MQFKPQPSNVIILSWATQLAEALLFIHSKDVIHGDLSTHNILVTNQEKLVLADFAGSPVHGLTGLVRYGTRHTSPNYKTGHPHIQNDIFAFGSILYEISSWKHLYPEIEIAEEWKIEQAYKAKRFPDTSSYSLHSIIQQCWYDKIKSAEVLLQQIRKNW
jgi:serine/threonine protein kinase